MIIQNILLPKSETHEAWEMYCRGKALAKRATGELYINKGNEISFLTFYNALQVRRWKEQCHLADLHLTLKGSGRVTVQFRLSRKFITEKFLYEQEVELTEQGVELDLPFWNECEPGLLFFAVGALTDTKLSGGFFSTSQVPNTDVKLAVCITHFNRQKQVIAAASELNKELLSDPDYKNISLIISDNSQNLKQAEVGARTILIKNRNTGGSGGFTRGLLEAKDRGFTHCLFMDDDAASSAESIKRVFAFYSYYQGSQKTAIAGILFHQDHEWVVHEAGGYYRRGQIAPINGGRNAIAIPELLELDDPLEKPNYGAWCFFAFAISGIEHLAFPFFVRGDDTLFSLHNKLNIITLLGVSTKIDSFLNKDNKTTFYLSTRSYISQALILKEASRGSVIRNFRRDSHSTLLRLQYSQSRGIYKAVYDVFNYGAEYFKDDPDGKRFRTELKKVYSDDEKYEPISSNLDLKVHHSVSGRRENSIQRAIRHLSFNGLFLPDLFFKKQIFWRKSIYPSLRDLYRYRQVIYFNDEANTYSIAKYSKKKIIAGLLRDFKVAYLVFKNFKKTQESFDRLSDYLTSEEYWRKVFKEGKE